MRFQIEDLLAPGLFDHVYLSPHLDDVAFSCSGTIVQQRLRGERILVLTVCTASPASEADVSAFARAVQPGGSTASAIVRCRQEEDVRAMELLDVAFAWASELDAIYRLPDRYDSLSSLTGEMAPEDPLTVRAAELTRRVAPGALLHAPLGVGRHVDHRIVHTAAAGAGRAVAFYEDFPYVALEGALSSRLSEVPGLHPVATDISSTLERRVAAAGAYVSQVAGYGGELEKALRRYALVAGNGTVGEREWMPV